jgi:rhodanese-related sulfurtransferase
MTARRVSPQEAQDLIAKEGYVYVDVRSGAEFDRGHPAGAVNVPLLDMNPALGGLTPNPEFVAVLEKLFGKGAKLIVGCQMGGRSARAAQVLVQAGFTSIVDQHAGFDGAKDPMGRLTEPGWSRSGLPVETDAPAERRWKGLQTRARSQSGS